MIPIENLRDLGPLPTVIVATHSAGLGPQTLDTIEVDEFHRGGTHIPGVGSGL